MPAVAILLHRTPLAEQAAAIALYTYYSGPRTREKQHRPNKARTKIERHKAKKIKAPWICQARACPSPTNRPRGGNKCVHKEAINKTRRRKDRRGANNNQDKRRRPAYSRTDWATPIPRRTKCWGRSDGTPLHAGTYEAESHDHDNLFPPGRRSQSIRGK